MRARSRPARSPAASARPSTTSSCASRRSWGRPQYGRAAPHSEAASDEPALAACPALRRPRRAGHLAGRLRWPEPHPRVGAQKRSGESRARGERAARGHRTAHRGGGSPPDGSRVHRADRAREARAGQARRARLQAAAGLGDPLVPTLETILPVLFVVALFLNIRASFKLGLDWRGMLTTVRFVRQAYARRAELPTRRPSSASRRRPCSFTWCPPFTSPTSRARCARCAPHAIRTLAS